MTPASTYIEIGERRICPGAPVYIVAEMSANHNQKFDDALRILEAAKSCGADAVKIQTYTADTMTLSSDEEYFQIGKGTIWEGRSLYDLYDEAYTPWDWQPKLKARADELGIDLFSSPFDSTAVDFLEKMNVPAYKVASFELVDLPLIEKIARTGKPIIMSTGMASFEEIEEGVQAARNAGATQMALLKCTSSYPAPTEEMNLQTIPDLARRFQVPIGLSDHTLGIEAAIASVALGACIIEKHFTLSREVPGPDSSFSLEPEEFKTMVEAVRRTEQTLGQPHYGPTEHEQAGRVFRRSLFAVENIEAGEEFTSQNVRSIRPGHGLAPKYLKEVLGKRASRPLKRGTPLDWESVAR
jgi:pseudaminic acid synthase